MHRQLREQLGREQVQVDFAIGVLAVVRPVEAMATGALLSSTRVKLVFRPRIATLRPSPVISRLMCTPGMRLKDSAMFVSGNLPMSSAKTESMKPTDSRLASVEILEARAEAGDDDFFDLPRRIARHLIFGGLRFLRVRSS